MNKTALKRLLHVKWLGIVLAVLLVAPVPALGLTFLGTWSFVQEELTNAPLPIKSSSDTANGGTLTIDMGVNPPDSGKAVSKIIATRNFNVATAGEVFDYTHFFETVLGGGKINTNVTIRRIGGGTFFDRTVKRSRDNNTGNTFTVTDAKTKTFSNAGDYSVRVKIKYTKKNNGIWDNSAPADGSPHRFTFESI